MYTLTPETLIRIDDASDPKRGFILKPWREVSVLNKVDSGIEVMLRLNGKYGFLGFKLLHPDAITEVE